MTRSREFRWLAVVTLGVCAGVWLVWPNEAPSPIPGASQRGDPEVPRTSDGGGARIGLEGASERVVVSNDSNTTTPPLSAMPVHPDLLQADGNVVAKVLELAIRNRTLREQEVEKLAGRDRTDFVHRAAFLDAMASLVLDQAVVRTLESGIAYLQRQPDRSGGADYFGGKRPYLTFLGEGSIGAGNPVNVVVPADNSEEVMAANNARRQAFDELAREVVAYYGTLGLEELKRRRESGQLELRGSVLPQSLDGMIRWRLRWAKDGLGVEYVQR